MAALPPRVAHALEHSPPADPVRLGFDDAATLLAVGYQQTEDGYGMLDPRDPLVQCTQEMNHLAGFLPELHEKLAI